MAITTTATAGTATRTRLDRADPYIIAAAAVAAPVTVFSSSISASKKARTNDATTAAPRPVGVITSTFR